MASRPPAPVDLTEAWRAGFSAGTLGTRPAHHRLAAVSVVLGALLLLRRGPHPIAFAMTVALLIASVPVVVIALAVETTVRQHHRWRDWARTCGVVVTWLICTGLALGVCIGWPAGLLLLVALAPIGWKIEGHGRGRRSDETPAEGPEDLYAAEWLRGYRDGSAVVGAPGSRSSGFRSRTGVVGA